MKQSQSFLKRYLDQGYCKHAIKLEYVDGHKTEPSEVMTRGLYFEHHLIGGTRHGEVPELPKLKVSQVKSGLWRVGNEKAIYSTESDALNNAISTDQKVLDELIQDAKVVMDDLGIVPIEVQPEWEHDGFEGHPDLVAEIKSLNIPKAIIDIKYTETKLDDRWTGWADIENSGKHHYQALGYTYLSQFIYGEALPFFFLIFGKSGWVRFIRIRILEESLAHFIGVMEQAKQMVKEETWDPIGDYNVCRKCQFFDVCNQMTIVPQVEIVEI